jgi:2-polyprenyl-6-methoxyphenol hydroxylase-like FAD-dependent oxidoreductase
MRDTHTVVTIVGAGPTGLTLAIELLDAGIPFRIIDAAETEVHESRALAIQARTLEVLERSGVAAKLVEAGDAAGVITLHARRTVSLPLFDDANENTPFPFLLFLSQASTERILLDHLSQRGIEVERSTKLVSLRQQEDGVLLETETPDGRSAFSCGVVVGCDGAHSAVRKLAGVEFVGAAFPQTFAIADVEVADLEKGPVHSFLSSQGVMFFFPLGAPASWRLLVMLPDPYRDEHLDLPSLQRVVDDYAGAERYRLHDPVWMTRFQVNSRYARRFRDGRVFLAGDAAHVHSPAGAQGMNTGIQDAVNLGWKLAQVLDHGAADSLLDTYDDERLPVARGVLRMTNRLFRMATTPNPAVRFIRPRLAPFAIAMVARSRMLRQTGFRVISEIGLTYRHRQLAKASGSERLGTLRAGDRLPAMQILVERQPVDLRSLIRTPRYLLAAINPTSEPPSRELVDVVRGQWPDSGPETWLLIRPDSYVAGIWRTRTGLQQFLDQILP